MSAVEEVSGLDESMLNVSAVETVHSVPVSSSTPLKCISKVKLEVKQLENGQYKCSDCYFRSVSKYSLVRHFRKHTGDKYTCDQCNRKFVEQYSLKIHGCVAKDKTFICHVCAKSFHSQQGLKDHSVRIHHEKGKYSCAICKEMFQNKCHFTNHLDLHYKLKKYKCTCGKEFGNKSNLTRHQNSCKPSMDKRHSCKVCHSEFARKDELTDHMQGKHSTKRYYCAKCNKSFAWRASLWRHTKGC